MKRPQFGIRLLLLVTALLATICGWRYWDHIYRMREWSLRSDVHDLRGRIYYLENRHLITGETATLNSEEIAELAESKRTLGATKP